MFRSLKLLLLVLSVLCVSSCATIISSGSQNVTISPSSSVGNNSRATVIVGSDKYNVNLPSVVRVSRSRDVMQVRVKEGKCHNATTAYNSSSFNFIVLLDILGGVLGLTSTTTDASTGAMWSYDDNMVVNINKKDECIKRN